MSHDFAHQVNAQPYSPAPQHFSHPGMADPNMQSRQQNVAAYASPHTYPSPSMQNSYTYPPTQGQQGNEGGYRSSPQGANMSLPPLNLPPIRVQDGQQPQTQQQPQQQPMGSPLPPPQPQQQQHQMPQYYTHPAHAQPGPPMMANMGPQFNSMRYQLPPQGDQRVLSGGRHKKEIKRRTKTGCLTCRKRRIKCDEAHPMCRNCQKSKRDCLGYDPIFKQQSGPAQIQPAPNSAPAPHAASAPPAPAPASTYSQSPVPQGYAPASSAGYAAAAPATSGEHQQPSFHAIDPALAQADSALHAQHYNGVHAMDPAMRAPPGATSFPPPPGPPMKGKRLTMSETFAICNHSPPEVPQRTSPVPREVDDEFTRMFINDYLQGLDMILETNWFSTNSNALNRVFSDRSLHEEAAYFTETVKYKTSDSDMSGVFSQEARLLWHLLRTCKHNTPTTNGSVPESEDLLLREARARFDILEALLTNQNLDSNPTRQLAYPAGLDEEKRMEVDFWQNLGDFVQYTDSDNAPPGAADTALAFIRSVLRMHEVRDAIYSVAIARHYGNRIGGFPNSLPAAPQQHPDSDLSKLCVAMTFISHESRAATQQVLARICDMAMVSWNVSRMPSNHQSGVFPQ
ncbi:c6 finger domain [Pyrenophora seminiperda CCB06]|uniref:C6 finger domain n=1 Tax=Pyrenophora seminiperda CCB06 TaxID=1302712 RepID=A0A3M7M2X4_9PLEO|nr:c6 finger domain [Pyrenophora seminiperda CCB06]